MNDLDIKDTSKEQRYYFGKKLSSEVSNEFSREKTCERFTYLAHMKSIIFTFVVFQFPGFIFSLSFQQIKANFIFGTHGANSMKLQ